MKVLFLATYFPKPGNPLLGTWALDQAQALQRQPIELRVVSFTPWIPRLAARSRGTRAYAECPAVYDWGSLRVEYPRWAAYPFRPITHLTYGLPALQNLPGWWTARPFLCRLVRKWRPDAVFAHHSMTNGALAERLHGEFGIPYFVTDHDFGEVADSAQLPLRLRALRRVARRAAGMIGVAARMEQDLRRLCPGARTLTLPNGTNPLPADLLATPRPAELAGRTVLFSAGMLYERKGFPLLLQAFAEAARDRPEAVLRIAGDGVLRGDIERTICRLGLVDRVKLLGAIPHRQVLQEMAWCDAFALLGWDEPFGVVFAEALSAGRPVVLSADAGICDQLDDQVHALKVRPRDPSSARDALRRVLEDGALRARLGAAGRERWASRLTWDCNAATLVSWIREAVEETRTG